MNDEVKVPTRIFAGAYERVLAHTQHFLQQHLCMQQHTDEESQKECYCRDCRKIKERQHPCVVWVTPEKDYTVEDVEVVFERIRFALDPEQWCFFVLEKADRLNLATANRLLKVLEEPPTGYVFLLLATNLNALLPTIISRALINEIGGSARGGFNHPVFHLFCDAHKLHDPFAFEQLLKKQPLTDADAQMLLDELMYFYVGKQKGCIAGKDVEQRAYIARILDFITQKMKKAPRSGSADLFLKMMYLDFPR